MIQSLPTLASHIGLLSPPMRTRPPGEAQEVWWYLDIYISTHIYTYLHISTEAYLWCSRVWEGSQEPPVKVRQEVLVLEVGVL